MPFDIEDITGADPGKGQKTSPGFDPSDIKAAAASGTGASKQNLISGTIDPNTNFGDFRFQPKTNADNYLLRAQDQGFWESLGKTIGNVAANIPLDIIQGVGYLGTTLEFGNDRDYTNSLTQQIEKLKNPYGEVYLEHPNQTFDLSDSAWWLNNIGQLAESAASFAIEGAGIAKLFGTVAKAAAWSTRAAQLGARAAQGLSAATLTYMEGAMSGAQVYETAYNNNYLKQIQQGINPTDADQNAKHIASQAAAATVQLHTAINLGLNLTGLAPMFREPDQAIVSWWRRNGQALPGETKDQWMARIAAAAPEQTPLNKLLNLGLQGPLKLGVEAFQEGLEEVNTQYAEHVGKAIGEGKEEKDVTHRLADLDRYFSEVLNQEGALNIALGALGGIAQTVLLEHIPVHKVVKYGPDGQPILSEGTAETQRISAHTMNERINRQYFDNIKDALSKDMNWFSEKNQQMDTALKNKDLATLARTRADLLSVHNLRAISLGMADVWKQQYHDIANLDNTSSVADKLQPQLEALTSQMQEAFNNGDTNTANQLNVQRIQLQDQINRLQDVTEAMQKGYTSDKSDNSYKEKALQAVQNLDYLTDLYRDMQDRYTGTKEMDASGLAEHMFYRQANQYLHKQQLDMMQQDLIKLKTRVDALTLTEQDDILVKQARDFLSDKEVLDSTVKKLTQDINRINEAVKNNDSGVLLKMLAKYKIPVIHNAGNNLITSIERRKQELQKRIDYSGKEFNDAISVWKEMNPEGKVEDVFKKAREHPLLEDMYNQNRAYYQQALAEYQTTQEQLAADSTNESINQFIKTNQPKDDKKKERKEHIEAYNQQLDREIAATMDARQKQSEVQKLDQRIGELTQTISTDQDRLNTTNSELKNLKGFFRSFGKRRELTSDQERYEHAIKVNTYELNVLKQRRIAMVEDTYRATQSAENVSRTPPPVVQPVTQTTPAATPAGNTIETQDQQVQEEQSNNLSFPEFDFSQEIIPKFTSIQDSQVVFDRIMGGQEAGNTFRQFIEMKRSSQVPYFLNAMKTMLQKVNLPFPSEEEVNKFVSPYIQALKDYYLAQKKNPAEMYEGLKSFLKPDVLTVLDILEGEFRNHGFSYDRALQVLNQLVKDGKLQKNMIGDIMNKMKDYLEYVQQPISTQPGHVDPVNPATDTQPAEPLSKDFNEEPGTYIPPIPDSEPTAFSNAALDHEIVEQTLKRFIGAQNIEAVKANFNTHPYKEFDNGKEIRIVSDYTQLDPGLNPDVLIPGMVNPGDDVIFEVDENFTGEINYDTESMQDDYGDQLRRADSFQNYLEAPGRIGMTSTAAHPRGAHANVPIKIIQKSTGKTLGYLPRADWITARYPDTQNYRNVTDTYQDQGEEVTDNVARQYARIIKLRENIARAWNTNPNLKLESKVSKKGTGHVMLNREVNSNTGYTKLVNRSAKNMLPDASLEIGVAKQGNVYIGAGTLTEKQLSSRLPEYIKDATSLPVVMLPSPDGTHMPVPLYTHLLGDNPSQLNTVIGAIELYLRATAGQQRPTDQKAIEKIREASGYDIRLASGLRDFIQQYFTYTQKFGEKDTVITPSEVSSAVPKFMLDIPDEMPGEKAAFIKVGTSFSGEKPIYAQLVDGELHPDFEQALREGLQNRFKNVIFSGKQLRGVNSPGEFLAPIIKRDGSVQVNRFQDYNEYIKANSVTFVYGLNKVGNQYVYMANPVVQVDYDQALKSAPPVISTAINDEEQTKEGPSDNQLFQEPDELADLFGNGMLSPSPGSVQPLQVPREGEQVTLEFLEELRNITPEAHRNSKTPEQVLRELLERGVTVLAEGHNPFYVC